MSNLNDTFCFSDSGSFKNVDIYEYSVYKYPRDEEEGYKMSESEARYESWCYDDEDNFHYSWVSTQYDSEVSTEESYEELYNEYHYAKAKKHLKIIVPILDGDEEGYYMPRVRKIASSYVLTYEPEDNYKKIKVNKIKKAVLIKYNKLTHSKKTISNISHRVDYIIKFGIETKLSDKKIIDNVFWFLIEDHYNDLLTDMHLSNFGLYHGNIVAFDLGRSSYSNRSKKKSPRTSSNYKDRLNSIKLNPTYREIDKEYKNKIKNSKD